MSGIIFTIMTGAPAAAEEKKGKKDPGAEMKLGPNQFYIARKTRATTRQSVK